MQLGSKVAAYLTESNWRILAAGISTALVVGVAKFGLVSFLLHIQTSRAYLRLQDAVLTGLLAAVAVWAVLQITSERRKYIRREIQTVANLNHELRNALEVIIGSDYLHQSNKGDAIFDSVERINRTLNNILLPESRHKQ